MRKPCLALGLAGLMLFSAASHGEQAPINLPQIGNPADLALSPAEEARIGKQVAAELYYYNYVLEDPEISEYLTALGWRLAAYGTDEPPPFKFFLIADPRINAFALPGAYIGMNAGLLLASGSESEVAGVMAHEQAHVTQRHAARGANEGQVETIATWLAVIAAIIAGSANPNVVIGALSLGQGINYNRQVSYTRSNEFEADRIGIRTLASAGYDPNGMAGFFAKLEQQTRLYGNRLPEILLTHPVNTTRIAEASQRAAQYEPRVVPNSPDYEFMRARVRVLLADTPNEVMGFFRGELEAGRTSLENQYGLAMALTELGQFEQSQRQLQTIGVAESRQASVDLLRARNLVGLGKASQAMATLRKALATFPRHPPVIFAMAEALINAGEPEEARRILLSHEQAHGAGVETHRLLANAARAAGNIAESQYQQAVYFYERGDIRTALQQVNAGLRVASISTQDRSRLSAKRQEMLETIPRDELRRLQREPG